MHRFKTLGLACVAALAFGAMSASAASASVHCSKSYSDNETLGSSWEFMKCAPKVKHAVYEAFGYFRGETLTLDWSLKTGGATLATTGIKFEVEFLLVRGRCKKGWEEVLQYGTVETESAPVAGFPFPTVGEHVSGYYCVTLGGNVLVPHTTVEL